MHRLIDNFAKNNALLTNERLGKAVERRILGTIGQAIEAANGVSDSTALSKRHSALLRAIHYGGSLRRPASVPELAAAADVSKRVLELVFHEIIKVSPQRYLRWSRMNGAQRDLLAAAAARNISLSGARADIEGDLADAPPRYTAIRMRVSAQCDQPAELGKLVTIAERGCIVANTLRAALDLSVVVAG